MMESIKMELVHWAQTDHKQWRNWLHHWWLELWGKPVVRYSYGCVARPVGNGGTVLRRGDTVRLSNGLDMRVDNTNDGHVMMSSGMSDMIRTAVMEQFEVVVLSRGTSWKGLESSRNLVADIPEKHKKYPVKSEDAYPRTVYGDQSPFKPKSDMLVGLPEGTFAIKGEDYLGNSTGVDDPLNFEKSGTFEVGVGRFGGAVWEGPIKVRLRLRKSCYVSNNKWLCHINKEKRIVTAEYVEYLSLTFLDAVLSFDTTEVREVSIVRQDEPDMRDVLNTKSYG